MKRVRVSITGVLLTTVLVLGNLVPVYAEEPGTVLSSAESIGEQAQLMPEMDTMMPEVEITASSSQGTAPTDPEDPKPDDPDRPVSKQAVKIAAKNKSYKASKKTKKYIVTLKTKKGKAISNASLTLKVNGKTYEAKTNKKGKAAFKLTGLKKAGRYKATIKYAGSKSYKSVKKKVRITVKK